MALSDEERAELEQLRAQKTALEEAQREQQERAELEQLRKQQKHALEDAEYYAEKQRRKEERRKAWENPDYGVEDLEPMPLKQKIVIAVIAVIAVLVIGYVVYHNIVG